METRFGVKDFFLFALVAVLIVLVVLAMIQYDRQWQQLSFIKQELGNQTRDLASLRQAVAQGNFAATAGSATTAPVTVPGFETTQQSRLRQVTQMPGYAPGDWLVQAAQSPPTRLTPLLDSDLFGSRLQDTIFDSLAVRNPETLEFIPAAAMSWEQSPDGKEVTFRLRRDVVFSDGRPMTADDVVFTFEFAMNPEVEAERLRVYVQKVDKVEKVDDHTVRFQFKEYYFQNFEAVSSIGIMPRHFYGLIPVKEFNNSAGLAMGSGPYRLSDPRAWKPEPGKPVELIRNERYWGVRPPFDRILWQMQPDPGARLIAFKNGETDRFGAQPDQYIQMKDDPAVKSRARDFVYQAPDDGYMYIGWFQQVNGKPTAFADKRVRQAMTMLIDREGIVRDILAGYGAVATGPFHPLSNQDDDTIKPWPFEPERAKALLREAGYEDRNGDGIVEDKDGKRLQFKLHYPSSSNLLERTCLYVKDTMRRGGVLCDTEGLEWSVLLERIRNKQVEAQISGWGGSVEGDLYQIFHSSGIEGQGDNRVSYASPELDKLIERARTTVDKGERDELWRQCHRVLHEDQPYTFLFTDDNLLFVDRRFENVQPNKLGVNSFREWFVRAAKQKWGR
ncbi:MAG TPA: peptide-binding protein [Tepidisphaeraceae bacterium]|nr:peptide-binding protein [Tepidisphaeraceae bacterium]